MTEILYYNECTTTFVSPSFAFFHAVVVLLYSQYPIYSALIAKLGGRQVGYELDESLNWAVSREELEAKLAKAKKTIWWFEPWP